MTQKNLPKLQVLLLLSLGFLLSWNSAYGQREVRVTPGPGTLNEAIFGDTLGTGERTDTNTVYLLQKGGLYLLDGTIENRFPLTIAADTGSGARPILQPSVGTGGSSSRALTPRADITLKGLYITNLDELGALKTRIIRARGDNMRIVIDDCHLDKDGQAGIRVDNPGMKIYITNSIFSNIGLMESPENGRGIDDRGNSIDTLVVENNTVYNLTSRFLRDDGGLINYAKVTNNTFYNLGQGSIHFGETVWALCQNNLFINTAFLGSTPDGVGGSMRVDSLSQANIDSGFVQCVVISHNNFYNAPALAAAFPDTISSIDLFNGPALAMMETSGYASTNVFHGVTFDSVPSIPTNVISTYYATRTDPMPMPDSLDDGGGGPDFTNGQVQFPFNFDYLSKATVVEGGTAGSAMGNGNNTAAIDPMSMPRIVNVSPGFGTLNAAIFGDTLNGERIDTNTVYVLERDGIYLLDATIENRFPLTIVAAEGTGARPVLRPAVGDGGSSSRALTPRADITLRGLYITNLDELGVRKTRIIRARGDNMRIRIEDCHLDKDGQSAIRIDNPGMKIYITHSIISNIGTMASPENGRGIDDRGNQIDSLVIENTTAYNLTFRFLRDDGGLLNYARIVHNTFYNIGLGALEFGEATEVNVANNLFIHTAFLGERTDGLEAEIEVDSLSQVNIDSGFVQRVNISHNNFHTDTSAVMALPDTVSTFPIYNATAQAFIDASGIGASNVSEEVNFVLPPEVPDSVIISYYETRTDPMPNPDNLDEGNGGVDSSQVQMPFDFNYTAVASVSAGSTKEQAMGSKQWKGGFNVGIFDPVFAKEVKLFNYPNPFSQRTTISYEIEKTSDVQLSIFDMNGHQVSQIVDKKQAAGSYEIVWEARDLSAGIYVYRIRVNDQIFTKKLVLLKQ